MYLAPRASVLTSQPHPDGKAAFEKAGVRVMSIWWTRRGSNPRPLRCERSALPAELRAHIGRFPSKKVAKNGFLGHSILRG